MSQAAAETALTNGAMRWAEEHLLLPDVPAQTTEALQSAYKPTEWHSRTCTRRIQQQQQCMSRRRRQQNFARLFRPPITNVDDSALPFARALAKQTGAGLVMSDWQHLHVAQCSRERPPEPPLSTMMSDAATVFLAADGVAYKTMRTSAARRRIGTGHTDGLDPTLLHEIYINFAVLELVRKQPSLNGDPPTVKSPRHSVRFRDALYLHHNGQQQKDHSLPPHQLVLGTERGQSDLFTWLDKTGGGKGVHSRPSASRWGDFYDHITSTVMAVADLHSRGIVHCDVKPENVILSVDGVAQLSDFDAATISNRIPSSNLTEAFMPPEAFAFLAPTFRQPSFDLWSLSMVMQVCVTGETRKDVTIEWARFTQSCRRIYDMSSDQADRLYRVYRGMHKLDPSTRMTAACAVDILAVASVALSSSLQMPLYPAPLHIDRINLSSLPELSTVAPIGEPMVEYANSSGPFRWHREWQSGRQSTTHHIRHMMVHDDHWRQTICKFVSMVERHPFVFSRAMACVALEMYIETVLSVYLINPSHIDHAKMTTISALASLDLAARICSYRVDTQTWEVLLVAELGDLMRPLNVAEQLEVVRQAQRTIVGRWWWGDIRRNYHLTPLDQWTQIVRAVASPSTFCKSYLAQPRVVGWRSLLAGWQSVHVDRTRTMDGGSFVWH